MEMQAKKFKSLFSPTFSAVFWHSKKDFNAAPPKDNTKHLNKFTFFSGRSYGNIAYHELILQRNQIMASCRTVSKTFQTINNLKDLLKIWAKNDLVDTGSLLPNHWSFKLSGCGLFKSQQWELWLNMIMIEVVYP